MKKFLVSERGLLIEAFIAGILLYKFLGFEVTVITFLAVIAAHVFKISIGQSRINES